MSVLASSRTARCAHGWPWFWHCEECEVPSDPPRTLESRPGGGVAWGPIVIRPMPVYGRDEWGPSLVERIREVQVLAEELQKKGAL